MRNELIVAIVMFLISIGGSIAMKNDKKWSVLFLFLAAVAGSLAAGMGVRFREIVEGPFGFLDSMLCVCAASVLVAVLDRAGHGKKIRGMPVKPLVLILRILEKLHLSPLYPWVYETASTDSFVSIEKAERILDYRPQYSNKQALVRNYEWYVEHLSEFKGKSGVSHRVPWKQGLLAVAKLFF